MKSCRGGLQNIRPPPLSLKNAFWPKWGEGGGGVYNSSLEMHNMWTIPVLESQRPVRGLRTPKSPKVPGRVLGKRGLLGGLMEAVQFLCFSKETGLPALLPAVPPAPGTLPNTLPGTFGDLGVLSPVAGRWDSKSSLFFSLHYNTFFSRVRGEKF